MRLALVVALAAVVVAGCDKKKSSSSPANGRSLSPTEATLAAGTWTGTLDKLPIQVAFTASPKGLTGEVRYLMFGGVRNRDKVAVTTDDSGTLHLKPSSPDNVVIGGKQTSVSEITGALSADKATLSGAVVHSTSAPGAWTVSTQTQIADVDPPFDIAAGEKALLTGKWEGKYGPRPAKISFTKKAGRLTGKLMVDRGASSFTLVLDNTGRFTMKAPPHPTQQGLLTETGVGYFMNHTLAKLRGNIESSVKQGFIEQSGSESWQFENLKAAKPAKGK